MKNARIQVLIGFFLTVSIIATYRVLTPEPVNHELRQTEISFQRDKIELKRRNLERNSQLAFWGIIGALGTVCGAVLIVASGWHRAHVKRANVHLYKVDEAEIWVHERDLSDAWHICTGLVNAKALEQSNAGMQKAFELYATMADIQNQQLRALMGSRGAHQTALPAAPKPEAPAIALPDRVPSMADLLNSGELAPEKPLILGFLPGGAPLRSKVEDNYSTVVIGASGSGKTTGEAYNVSSAILSCGARHTILDLHYPDKKKESLGDRLGDLVHTGFVTLYNNPLLLDEIVERLDLEFEEYKRTGRGHVPHIIVVDEHKAWISSTTGGADLLRFEEKIIFQGRKYDWYLHVTSKSALAEDFGSSAIRDNFVTSMLYRGKKHQAKTFFKDADLTALLDNCKKEGQAVYTNNAGKSDIIQVPLCTIADMQTVARRVANGGNVATFSNALATPSPPVATGKATEFGNVANLLDSIQNMLANTNLTTSQIAREAGIDKGHLSRILNGKRELTPDTEEKLKTWKQRHRSNVVPFPTQNH